MIVFLAQEVLRHPPDLHEHGSNRAQDRQRTPLFPTRDHQEADIKKRDVTEQTRRIILCSNEYVTKNATPRNSASPPIHANSFAPINCSQLIAGSEGCGAGSPAEGG